MKKLFSILLAGLASVCFSTAVLAKNVDASPATKLAAVPASASYNPCDPYYMYPTCISVSNLSSYPIYITVSDLGTYMMRVDSGMAQPLVSSYYDYPRVNVALYNMYQQYITTRSVPNRGNLPVIDGLAKGTVQVK